MKKTGIFGGSFNPVHTGHLILAELAAEDACLDEVLFIPAGTPPHKSLHKLAAAEHRWAMLKMAVENNPGFTVSDVEMTRKGPSYTYNTVEKLKKNYGEEAKLFLLLGADSVRDIHKWHRAGELIDSIEIIGLGRPDVDTGKMESNEKLFGVRKAQKLRRSFLELPQIDIAASDIRYRVRNGKTIRYLVPENVREYIKRNGLYSDV